MTNPITPPQELLQLWFEQHYAYNKGLNELLIEVARYGADRELEACITWLDKYGLGWNGLDRLRIARRPKPPSLKEQALDELTAAERLYPADWSTIRHALESLPND